jgi:hypothetical protein
MIITKEKIEAEVEVAVIVLKKNVAEVEAGIITEDIEVPKGNMKEDPPDQEEKKKNKKERKFQKV